MNIFLCYASEDRQVADKIHLALAGGGHEVFFDRSSLPPGDEFHERIRAAVARSDLVIFLISQHSVSHGGYALTELKYARERWPHPRGRVMPVLLDTTPLDSIPSYLTAVTVLEPEGSAPAEVAAAVARLQHKPPAVRVGALVAIVVAAAIGWYQYSSSKRTTHPDPAPPPQVAGPQPTTKAGTPPRSVAVPVDQRPYAIINVHETGTVRSFTSVVNLGDDLWYGSFALSFKTGTLSDLLLRYAQTEGARFAPELGPFLAPIKQRKATLLTEKRFTDLLVRIAGEDPLMAKLQQQEVARRYFDPARQECANIGIKSLLGYALIADTYIHSGEPGYRRIKLATISGVDGTPVTGIDERVWLRRFAEERLATLLRFFDLASARAASQRRVGTYTALMDAGKWDLSGPIRVGGYLFIDPQ